MSEEYSLDSILVEIGQFGNYQFKNYVLLSVPIAFSAAFTLSYLFTAGSVTYRCNITECDSPTSSFYEPWTNYTIPGDQQCLRYASNNNKSETNSKSESCFPTDFNSNKLEKCGQFKFLNNETTISQEVSSYLRQDTKLTLNFYCFPYKLCVVIIHTEKIFFLVYLFDFYLYNLVPD